MNTYRVDNKLVQEADNIAKETHLPFRDCLEILVRASLRKTLKPVADTVREYELAGLAG